jgi:hypothetical protein
MHGTVDFFYFLHEKIKKENVKDTAVLEIKN